MEYIEEMGIGELYKAGIKTKDRVFEIAARNPRLATAVILAPTLIGFASYVLSGVASADHCYYSCRLCPADGSDPTCVSACTGPHGEYWDGRIQVYDNPIEKEIAEMPLGIEPTIIGIAGAITAKSKKVRNYLKGMFHR